MGLKLKLDGKPIAIDGDIVANRFVARLDQEGERAVKGISDVIRKGGQEIQDLAKAYAPYAPPELGGSKFEREHLQEAIEVRESRDVNRRLAVEVFVNGRRKGHQGRTIATYAWLMHEGLGPYGDGRWHPRAGTIAKNPYAGGKYLERAYRDMYKKIMNDAEGVARRIFGR